MREFGYIQKSSSKKIPIIVGEGHLDELGKHIASLDFDKIIIISDDKVCELWGKTLEVSLSEFEYKIFTFANGEASKNLLTFENIANQILDWGISKRTLLIAFGGGVVGNLAGFIASSLYRGLKFVQVPTTLMAMADSSLGGKQGVNTKHGKNLIGTFYEPELIFIDYRFLDTLPRREFESGIAECIKHAICQDERLFDSLMDPDSIKIQDVIERVIELKVEILNQDPRENAIGKTLVYGHTIGHAIESLSHGALTHGEAISIGMSCAAKISFQMKLLSEEVLLKHKKIFERWDLPTSVPKKFNSEAILEMLSFDKKYMLTELEFVLVDGIGHVHSSDGKYSQPIPSDILQKVLN